LFGRLDGLEALAAAGFSLAIFTRCREVWPYPPMLLGSVSTLIKPIAPTIDSRKFDRQDLIEIVHSDAPSLTPHRSFEVRPSRPNSISDAPYLVLDAPYFIVDAPPSRSGSVW
jgi:hypothetical protein